MTTPQITLTLSVLREMKQIFADERSWTVGSLARTERGIPCDPLGVAAKCFCIAGAMDRAIANLKLLDFARVRAAVSEHLKKTLGVEILLGHWNDASANYHIVCATLDRAIALAEHPDELRVMTDSTVVIGPPNSRPA